MQLCLAKSTVTQAHGTRYGDSLSSSCPYGQAGPLSDTIIGSGSST